MFTIGVWDIIEFLCVFNFSFPFLTSAVTNLTKILDLQVSKTLKYSQKYGKFNYLSSSVLNFPGKGKFNVGVDILGYGSQSNIILENTVYML